MTISRSASFASSVVFSLVAIGLSSQAFAMHHHQTIESDVGDGKSACVFPDGTSPKGQPGMHCYTPAQFMAAYGIDKLHAQGITGKGQTIILADSFGSPTMQADLDHFSETFGLPKTKIKFIYPNGAFVNPMTTDDQVGWAGETTLDLEWAHAVAPDATLVNIVTTSSETTGMAGLQDLFKGIQMATTEYPGAVLSMSFGTGEGTFSSDEIKTFLQGSLHQILADATAADITLLASAGDSGSDNVNLAQTSMQAFPDASYPATDPLITAVGGTALESDWLWTPEGTADQYWDCKIAKNTNCPTDFLKTTEARGTRIESVWKEDWAIAAGGGGVSTVFAAQDFQAGVNADAQKLMNGFRAIPDVSMNAAINGGVEVYSSYVDRSKPVTKFLSKNVHLKKLTKSSNPTWQQFGGTSCASPETAGLIALAGEAASKELGKTVGIGALNPILYQLKSEDFYDIVSESFGAQSQVVIDNNALYFNAKVLPLVGAAKMPPSDVIGYKTTPGYDLATGLGSPRAEKFVLDIAAARVANEALKQVQLK